MPKETCVACAYIANSGSNNVSVIDSSTSTVVAAVRVGSYPYGLGVTPDNTHVYVRNENGDTVSVIDTSTNTVAATVSLGSRAPPDAASVLDTIYDGDERGPRAGVKPVRTECDRRSGEGDLFGRTRIDRSGG
jgi:YVTN family beta-propeller protein